MKVLKSYFAGLKEATVRPKMIFLLWLINFIFASAVYFIISDMWNNMLGSSRAAGSLAEKIDFTILLDALLHNRDQVSLVLTAGLVLIGLYVPVSLLLKGGILHSLRQPPPIHPEDFPQKFLPRFFQGAGKYFGRFFRLWLFSLLLWGGFILINMVLFPIGSLLTGDGANEHMVVYVFIGRVAIALFLVLLIKMIMDYARIKIVVDEASRVSGSFLTTLQFVFRHLGKTLILFYLLFLTGIALMVASFFLKSNVPSASLAGAVLAFAVGQAVIYIRSWSNVTFQAAQLRYFERTP
jgi:hypothetical protein